MLELGCGDGRAFALYGRGVEHVLAVEPDPAARVVAVERAREAAVPIDVVEGEAGAIPAADGAFDAAVLVWVLCSVPDQRGALREVRRVLRPDGELRFYEHVRSRNPAFRTLQGAADRLFWTRALGGCRTTRDTGAAIRDAGFAIEWVNRGFHSSSPLTVTSAPYLIGIARPG